MLLTIYTMPTHEELLQETRDNIENVKKWFAENPGQIYCTVALPRQHFAQIRKGYEDEDLSAFVEDLKNQGVVK